tara:strand:- start:31 stop:264 length:234 start_codon:yes stop_codon:yes gene_type:complete
MGATQSVKTVPKELYHGGNDKTADEGTDAMMFETDRERAKKLDKRLERIERGPLPGHGVGDVTVNTKTSMHLYVSFT